MEEPHAVGDPSNLEPRYTRPVMHTSSKGQTKVSQTVTTSTSAISKNDSSKSFDTNGKTITRTSASRFRDLQLAKRPLQIAYGDFDCYRVDLKKRQEFSRCSGFDGILCVHVLCGQGLKCARMTLRDLYCVISVDSLNKARTMIRTGAVNFDWDEAFDVDVENAKDVSFLIYNWDPNYKHRLCFHGSIFLPGFIDSNKKKHIALKMEPKGLLYITILFQEPKEILQRVSSTKRDGVFGVDLDTVIKREHSSAHVPLLVLKSIAEIERRGMEVVGIYRLCGSSRRKAQLREAFEKNAANVDLSPENVSDIHVITGVLKDYLRELPEPLVTNALYQMMLDALSVRLPGDPDGSATLMLSILECLPKSNQETMSMMLNHLHKMAVQSDKNKMGLDQLATCLGPVILCPSSLGANPGALEYIKHIEVLKYLLEVWAKKDGTESSKPSSSATSPKPDRSVMNVKTGSPDPTTTNS
ncbi:rho GTPase-activating protein 100F-like [Mya arenaria]|nr:rho GTPase-activating protein 100F-like [Mya arenaria]